MKRSEPVPEKLVQVHGSKLCYEVSLMCSS
jgi:hypothetical protein